MLGHWINKVSLEHQEITQILMFSKISCFVWSLTKNENMYTHNMHATGKKLNTQSSVTGNECDSFLEEKKLLLQTIYYFAAMAKSYNLL